MANQITPNPSVPSQVVAEVKFPKFINNLGIIPTSYKDSMSYYECLAWLCKYLEETVIPTVNQNGEAVEELQSLYIQLNEYVTNYFDTLDVQEEINNKLDQMVETGQLQELLYEQYTDLRNEVNYNLSIMNSKIDSSVSGSPAGVYATVEALTSADPNHSKIYLVSANGYWYYYNTTLSSWSAGGVYQASEDSDTLEEVNLKIQSLDENLDVLRNVANPTEMERETVYITPTDKRTNNAWSTILVSVKPSSLYTVWNCDSQYSWFSNESNQNLGAIGVTEGLITTPATCNQLRLSINNTTSYIFVVEGDVTNTTLYLADELDYLQVVSSLSNNLDPIKETIYFQYVDTDKSTEDRYWSYANLRTAEGYLAYDPIIVQPGTYTLYNAMGEFTFYREGSEWHQLKLETGIQMNNVRTVLTFEDPTTLYITRNPIAYDTMLINSNITAPNYINYGAFTSLVDSNKVESLVQEYLPKTYYVGANQDYTSIKEAITEAIKYENSQVYILPGIYNIIQEFGEEYLNSTNSERGIELKNNIHLIFSQGAKVLCNYTGSNSYIKQNFSAFNSFSEYSISGVTKSGFIIDGLNIEASNIRYIIHDEKSGSDIPYTNIYKNCTMEFDNTNNNVFATTQCIGGGLGTSGEIIIENCIFDTKQIDTSVNTVPAVSYHNDSSTSVVPVNSNYRSNIIVKDNYFKGEYNTFRAGYIGVFTEITPCLVSNNNMGANPILIAEQSGAPHINMSLINWNNYIRS